MNLKKFINIISRTIIPGDKSKGILSGEEVNFYEFLDKNNKVSLIDDYYQKIEEYFETDTNIKFHLATDTDIQKYVDKSKRKYYRVLNDISLLLCECYYSNSKALSSLKLPVKPPFPEGYELQDIDLSILEVVYNRGKIYRL